MSPKTNLLTILIVLGSCACYAQTGELWGFGYTDAGTLMFKTNADGTGLVTRNNFLPDPGGNNPVLSSQLAEVNGKMYGMTLSGGVYNQGVIYEFNPANGVYTKKIDFDGMHGREPQGLLAAAANGKLYGITTRGGTADSGVIFEFDPATNVYSVKYDFVDLVKGQQPKGGLTLAPNNKFYGYTMAGGGAGSGSFGVIFEFDPATGTYTAKTDLSSLTGGGGVAPLTLHADGTLYGLMQYGGVNAAGTIINYNITTNVVVKRANLSTLGGSGPWGGLTVGFDLKLYGMGTSGGAQSKGTVFSFDPSTNAYTILYDFDGTHGSSPYGSLTLGANHHLYGLAWGGTVGSVGVVFEIDPAAPYGTGLTVRYNFPSNSQKGEGFPMSTLALASNGNFYGVAGSYGAKGGGTLFEFNPNTNTYAKKYDFSHGLNGEGADGKLVRLNDKLFGVTRTGGTYNGGTIFEYDLITKVFTKRFDFNDYSITSTQPVGGLTLHPNGKFYGVTYSAGINVGGLFEWDPAGSGTFTLIRAFNYSADGGSPVAGLTLLNNKLYGVNGGGGSGGGGTIFEYDPAGAFTVKYNLSTLDGTYPGSALIVVGTKLYGVNQVGGVNANGTIFEYDPAGTFTKKVDFSSATTGNQPRGGLVLAPNGKIYGTTAFGGANDTGLIFEFDPATSTYTKKIDFGPKGTSGWAPDGDTPSTDLILSNGKLYGVAAGGASNKGVLYEYDPATNALLKKLEFNSYGFGSFGTLTYVTSSLTAQTIAFTPIPTKTFLDAPFTLAATASSGLPLTFTSTNTAVATVSGTTVTIVGMGTASIIAAQAGDATYADVTAVQTLVVGKANQTITFSAVAAKTFGDPAFTLSATSSSGLPVQFSTTSDKVQISGNTVTIFKAGALTVKADQPGNTSYNAATTVTTDFCINPEKPRITYLDLGPMLSSSAFTGNQWYLNGTAIASATDLTYTVKAPGLYTVKVTVETCTSVASDAQVIIVTGDISDADNRTAIFPNPVKSRLSVQLNGYEAEKNVEVVVYDMQGKIIERLSAAGKTTVNFDVSHYAGGRYILRTAQDNRTSHYQFIKD